MLPMIGKDSSVLLGLFRLEWGGLQLLVDRLLMDYPSTKYSRSDLA